MEFLVRVYAYILAWPALYRVHRALFHLSLRGMGVLNHQSERLRGERRFLMRYLPGLESGWVIDIGANEGAYAKVVAELNPGLGVIALEPHPETFLRLERNLEGTHVDLINAAVGAVTGKSILHDYAERDGTSHASLYENVFSELHKSEFRRIEVETVRLQDVLLEKQVDSIALLKLDVEGGELPILHDISHLLAGGKVRAIHFEFNEMNVISRSFFKDFWDLLSDQYDIYRLLPHGLLRLPRYAPLACEVFAYQNIVALAKSSSQG